MKKTTVVYDKVTANIQRINLLRGGARSTKTHSLIQVSMKWLWTGKIGNKVIPKGIAIIARETFPALRRTVLREFETLMHTEGLMPYVQWRKAVHEFEFQGRQIIFLSLDDITKILGMQTVWFWINEPNPIGYSIFQQLLMRCESFCFLDYNPFDEDGWINQELELKRMPNKGDVNLTVSTFRMNPYLPAAMVEEIEYLKETDYELYQVYNQGNWAKVTGLIFTNWEYMDKEKPPETNLSVAGLDFGFNHATALIGVTKDEHNLYWDQLIYERGLTGSDIITRLAEIGFPRRKLIIADRSRPDIIKEIQRAGYRIKPARQNPKSVRARINVVKSYKLWINGEDIIREIKRYKWKQQNNDESIENKLEEEPIKTNDDAMDAGGYASEYLHRKRKFSIV